MEKSKIVAAVPFHVSKGGQVMKGSTPGFHQLIPDLSELGKWTRREHDGVETKDAIPSGTARLEIFHNQLYTSDTELGSQISEQEELWRRIVSLFALSRYRSLDIEIEEITRNDCSDLMWMIFGKGILQTTGLRDKVLLMKYESRVIAVSDMSTIWTPVSSLKDLEKMGFGGIDLLEPYERDLILSYLERIKGLGLDCDTYIQRFAKALEAAGAVAKRHTKVISCMGECNRQWNRKAQSVIDTVFSVPEPEISVPYPFFDSLYLTIYKIYGRENNLRFQLTSEEGTLTLTALFPLSRELVRQMEASDDIRLADISIDGSEFKKNKELSIRLELIVGNESIVYQKTYINDNVYLCNNMPSISLFPYVNLPDEVWHDYNLILLRGSEYIDGTKLGLNVLDASSVDLEQFPTSRQAKAGSSTEWYYAKTAKLPKFITLCRTNMEDDNQRNKNKGAGYIGCLMMEPQLDSACSQSVFNNDCYWAIDLGTSNTIAALKGFDGRVDYSLIRKNMHTPLLGGRLATIERFAEGTYASLLDCAGKFRTMGIVYQNYKTGTENHCYEHGCALFSDFTRMVKSLNEQKSLAEAQIITDIKFGIKANIDAVALHIYLENLLWLGCLNAALNGAKSLTVMISYPRKEVLRRIEKVWAGVQKVMASKCNLKIKLEYMTEAEANYRYQKQNAVNSDEEVAVTNDFGIIDIGHGTSDMNLYFHTESEEELPKQVQISIRYAGKEILVDTINSFFQNEANGFRDIWNVVSEGQSGRIESNDERKRNDLGIELIRNYEDNALEISNVLGGGGGGKLDKAGLKAKQSDIVITLLQEIGLRENLSAALETEKNRKLVMMLRFKYMNLFLIYASLLQDCPHSASGGTFKLFIYGGGRHGMRAITGELLAYLSETELGRAIKTVIARAMKIPSEQVDIIVKDVNKKNEVVAGMLYNDMDHAERREVYTERRDVETFLGYPDKKVALNIWDENLKKELETTYNDFVEAYNSEIKFLAEDVSFEDEGLERLYCCIAIDMQHAENPNEKELITKNRISFEKRAQIIWNSISNDTENPTKIRYLLFCCKMSESILLDNLR